MAGGKGGFIIYRNYAAVPQPEFCLAFEDNFEILDLRNWRREVQVGGFGTGSFDWTTTDDRNSYVDSEGLHIVPTLTTHDTNITPDQLFDGYTLNLTKDGSCTAPRKTTPNLNLTCTVISNYTSGATIPPVRSARLSTEGKHSIRYGRVEVVAKMGKGDWFWPAIWMMPEMGGAYGPWPASGEIDLAEFRGNDPRIYGEGGRDAIQSTIHWGPDKIYNRFWQTTAKRKLVRDDFSKNFRTFGLEWTPDYLFLYLDNRLNVRASIISIPFAKILSPANHANRDV
ncbi:Beta-glucanase [Dactylellina cionopaga]|nr:Beta-glucanase [Dactylellina cionopaga]